MRVNILRTRCMVLAFTVLQMAIVMKEHGMKAEGKDSECIHLEMVNPNLVTGKMESSTFQAHRTLLIQFLLLESIIPKYSMQCRYVFNIYELYPLVLNAIGECCWIFYLCPHGVLGISVWNLDGSVISGCHNIFSKVRMMSQSILCTNFARIVLLIIINTWFILFVYFDNELLEIQVLVIPCVLLLIFIVKLLHSYI